MPNTIKTVCYKKNSVLFELHVSLIFIIVLRFGLKKYGYFS